MAGVGEAEKVLFATHYLAGPARAWWETTKVLQQADHVATWAEFQEKFRRLRQGSKDVVGYLDEFID